VRENLKNRDELILKQFSSAEVQSDYWSQIIIIKNYLIDETIRERRGDGGREWEERREGVKSKRVRGGRERVKEKEKESEGRR
jgi:hypothetical protein